MNDMPANAHDEFFIFIDRIAEDYFRRAGSNLSLLDKKELLFDVYQAIEPSGRDVRALTPEELQPLQDVLLSLFPHLSQLFGF